MEATHYINLPRPVGRGHDEFWLDPAAFARGKVRGNDGWDEQCPQCGRNINDAATFTSKLKTAVRHACGVTYTVHHERAT